MSASYVALAVELQDLEEIYPIIESGSQDARQAAFLAFVNEQFDSEYEEDLSIEDIAFEGGRVIVEYVCSAELCNEVTHALFEGLAEQEGEKMAALEYNARIGVYTILVPGYDEAENVDECFEDFDGLMHELEEVMDRRDQLMHVLELMETEPVASALREHLGEDEDTPEELPEEEPTEKVEAEAQEEPAEAATGEPIDTAVADESGPAKPSADPLMDELRQAMADGDEDRVNELFEMVQNRSKNR